MVFNEINVDGYFMEWDDDRSGGFEPLRFLPKGKMWSSASSPRRSARLRARTI